MRRLITLFIIMLLPVILMGQTILLDVHHLTVGERIDIYENGEFDSYVDWGEGVPSDLTLALDLDNGIVKINNEMESTFYLDEGSASTEYDIDEDGYKTTYLIFDAKDADNKRCSVELRSWEDINFFQLYVIYSDFHVCLDCKFKDEKGV